MQGGVWDGYLMPRENFLYLNLAFVPLTDEAPPAVIEIHGRRADRRRRPPRPAVIHLNHHQESS